MAKKVKISTQKVVNGHSTETVEEVIVDNFNLREDFYDYLSGVKKDPNGNSVMGAMIGENKYVRFSEVVDISVEDMEEQIK